MIGMSKIIHKSKLFMKRNAPTILTCIGGVGVVATVVMAVRATPKALELIEDAKKEKGEDLTKFETAVTAAPVYIPTVITGAATLACIFGANTLNKRQQAALMSAYALLDHSYKNYQKKAEELYGEGAGIRIREEIAKDEYKETDIRIEEGKELFYDMHSNRYFQSTLYDVQQAEYRLNRNLITRDYAYLNEFYEELGIEPVIAGYSLGWSRGANLDVYWQEWIDFDHEKVVMDDGLECHIIKMQCEPIPDFEDYI